MQVGIHAAKQKIIPLCALKDNYIWLGVNEEFGQAFVVDPGEAQQVLDYLHAHELELVAIFITHKHVDHTGGLSELCNAFPGVSVYAHPVENVSFTTVPVQDGQVIHLKIWPEAFRVIHIPGHTLGHVAFYAKPVLFSGDTLFSAGCGRIFEGTAEQMQIALDKLAALPEETLLYCGHEYTLSNLRFAAEVEPKNKHIVKYMQHVNKLRADDLPTLPSVLGIEKLINPFLRCREQTIVTAVENHAGQSLLDTPSVFHELREWKNKL